MVFKVPPEDVRKLNLPPESLYKTPSGEIFVKPELQKVMISWHILNSCNNLVKN
jgi:hypothetical protein